MRRYKVLLVDDEPYILEGLQILLDWSLYHCDIVGTAINGIDGLQKICDLQPDIVISDIQMPQNSGIEMIEKAADCASCKFIILTGFSDFSYAKQCISLGVEEYILKPIEVESLIQAIQKVQAQLQNEASHRQIAYRAQDYRWRDFVSTYFDSIDDLQLAMADYELELPSECAYCCALLHIGRCRTQLFRQ